MEITRGSTFSEVMNWGAAPMISKPITNITKAYPTVITSALHGLVDGWPVNIDCVGGMKQINDARSPPDDTKDADWHDITYIDANTFSIDVNACAYSTYTANTGIIITPTPVDMAGYTFRMAIKDAVGGKVLITSTTGDTRADSTDYRLGQIIAPGSMTGGGAKMLQCTTAGTSGTSVLAAPAVGSTVTDGTVVWTAVHLGIIIVADNIAKTITRTISAALTSIAFPKATAVYDFEAVLSGVVEKLDSGDVEIGTEVTT